MYGKKEGKREKFCTLIILRNKKKLASRKLNTREEMQQAM